MAQELVDNGSRELDTGVEKVNTVNLEWKVITNGFEFASLSGASAEDLEAAGLSIGTDHPDTTRESGLGTENMLNKGDVVHFPKGFRWSRDDEGLEFKVDADEGVNFRVRSVGYDEYTLEPTDESLRFTPWLSDQPKGRTYHEVWMPKYFVQAGNPEKPIIWKDFVVEDSK